MSSELLRQSSTRVAMVVLMLAGSSVAADTEIHRCLLQDGTIAFQETPCPELAEHVDGGSEAVDRHSDTSPSAVEDDAFDFVNPFDEPENSPLSPEPTLPEPVSHDGAECEKITRDAIDAIDLEMRGQAYTKEQGKDYLAKLLALTQQLRACKQL